jgi:hypothetical protein
VKRRLHETCLWPTIRANSWTAPISTRVWSALSQCLGGDDFWLSVCLILRGGKTPAVTKKTVLPNLSPRPVYKPDAKALEAIKAKLPGYPTPVTALSGSPNKAANHGAVNGITEKKIGRKRYSFSPDLAIAITSKKSKQKFCGICKKKFWSPGQKLRGRCTCSIVSSKQRAVTIKAPAQGQRGQDVEQRREESTDRRWKWQIEHASQAGAYGRSRRH